MLDLLGATELSPQEAATIARALGQLGIRYPYIAYPRSVSLRLVAPGDAILLEALGAFGPSRWLLRAESGADEYNAFIGVLIRTELKGAWRGPKGRC